MPTRFAPYEPRAPGEPRAALPTEVRVRAAGQDDAPAVARLMAEREGGDAATLLEKLKAEFHRADIGGKRLLLVAELRGEVVGFGRALHCVPAADAPPNAAPQGWYLGGVVVAAAHRRCGIARELTRRRLDWLRERGAADSWFVVNAENRASIDLHASFGFREVTRDFVQAGVSFSGRGEGILFRAEL